MSQPGYVYFLHAVGTPRVKIGKAGNFPKRFLELQRQQHPYPLRLLRVDLVEDMDASEKAYHLQYAIYRVHNEWFEMPAEFMAQFPEPLAAQEYNPVGHLGRKKRQAQVKATKVIGNLDKLRAILKAEGHVGPDANPHRALAYYQRRMLRLMMEYDDQSRDFLIGTGEESKWKSLVLDEMIALGRVIQTTRHDQLACAINRVFLPREWQIAEWIDEYVMLIASPKTYNKALTSHQRDQLLFEAKRIFARKIG